MRSYAQKSLFSDNTDNILQYIFGREKKIKWNWTRPENKSSVYS